MFNLLSFNVELSMAGAIVSHSALSNAWPIIREGVFGKCDITWVDGCCGE